MIRLNMAEEKKLVEGIGCLITFREVLLEGLMTSDFREAEGLHTLVFNRKCISLSPKKKIIKKLIQTTFEVLVENSSVAVSEVVVVKSLF